MTDQKNRGHHSRPCTICGKTGHLSTAHRTDVPTSCRECNALLTPLNWILDGAPRYKEAGVKIPVTICKFCQYGNNRAKYRTSLPHRLNVSFSNAKLGASRDGRYFDITKQFLKDLYDRQEGLCYYTGIPMSLEKGHHSLSIDRVDPTEGYTEENCVLCLWIVNNAKRDLTYDAFIELCRTVYEHCKE